MKKEKIYPESGVELNPFIAKHYDRILAWASLGHFPRSIKLAIQEMDIQPGDHILDLGCGTGFNAQLMTAHLKGQGSILGLDISEDMARQFHKRFAHDQNIKFQIQRIDQPFQLNRKFNKIFIGFVIHGFPHEIRQIVIQNALNHLEEGGSFYILDFSEFDMSSMPSHHRAIFKAVECKYAFDFIERDWKTILMKQGFKNFNEYFFLRKYMRLLQATI
jgi:ubiquinone/menaquinone biosynthesis C-methylase UbiE